MGVQAIGEASRARLQSLVRYARTYSPLYRDAYRGLPEHAVEAGALPVMTKRLLMDRFDEWPTDRAITRTDVDAFLANRAHIGERYRNSYIVWTSSGSTGEPGIYIQDDAALAAYDALVAVQLASPDFTGRWIAGSLKGGRAALIAATGDHFASVTSWERVCRSNPGLAARSFSIMEPLDSLVAALNDYAPAYLASYPTMLALLAQQKAVGRLRISPALAWSGGEYLAPGTQAAIEGAFGCPVLNEYGSSESLSIAFGCREDWLHVNADWVILEPVDERYRPVPPGEASSTVLLTNLANRVQPLIRYDLGDSVTAKGGRCACGNPLPAIRVQGRQADVLTMNDAAGAAVRLLPLALATVIEEAARVYHFQIAQTAANVLSLRFDCDARGRVAFSRAAEALRGYLERQGVSDARIVLDERPPRVDPRSGKLRQVVIEHTAANLRSLSVGGRPGTIAPDGAVDVAP